MTLEQYAYLGEIAAAIGVVISLVYVARQMGQNTEMLRLGAASERVERDYEIAGPIIESREVAELWTKGQSDWDSLDEVDQNRLMFFERRAIVLWHHLFQLRQKNLLPDADWHEHRWIIRNLGRRRPIREAWKFFGAAYESSFTDFIDREFAIADEAPAGASGNA